LTEVKKAVQPGHSNQEGPHAVRAARPAIKMGGTVFAKTVSNIRKAEKAFSPAAKSSRAARKRKWATMPALASSSSEAP